MSAVERTLPGTARAARAAGLFRPVIALLERLAPAGDLVVRLWVAEVFWQSGTVKLASWATTVQLFRYEYEVPLLSPEVAAFAGTFTELFFPVLLALGLGGRLAAGVLFAFNIVAVISYPALNEAGREQHVVWGIMLLLAVLRGPGKLSLDHLLRRKLLA